MNRVEEIEAAIDGLAPAEYRLIVDRLCEREEKRWNLQLDSDSFDRKLDFLFDEAVNEDADGHLRPWPLQK